MKTQRHASAIPLLVGLAILFSQSVSSNAQSVLTEKPAYDKPIVFGITSSVLKGLEFGLPQAADLLVYKNLSDRPETVGMKQTDSVWTAAYTLSDTGVKVLYYAFRFRDDAGRTLIDDAQGKCYDVLMTRTDGKSVRGAYEARALSFTGYSDRRREDLDGALEDVQKELSTYPNNLSALNLRYTLLLKRSSNAQQVRIQIAGEVRSLLNAHPKDETFMQFAVSAFRLIGQTNEADALEKKLIASYPKSESAAQQTLSDIMRIEQPATRLEKLERFIRDFPGSRMEETVLAQIVTASIETDDTGRMVRTGDTLLKQASTPGGANALAALAAVFADRNEELDRAEAYIMKALAVVQSEDRAGRPSQMDEIEWRDQQTRTEGRYYDVLGWVHLKKGNLSSAREELKKAKVQTFQANVFYHLGVLSERSGNTEEASDFYGKAAAFGGKASEKARTALKTLWLKTGKDTLTLETVLDKQRQWVEQENKLAILAKRISRPAPDFKLADASGGTVRLSSQLGNPVLLCFWAGWSQASLRVLEDLQQLSQAFGKDVLFITVCTDQEPPTLKKLPNGDRFFLTMLVGSGVEKQYGIQGVPMVYVIDANGQIRYENKGYRPDLVQVLSVQMEDVLTR